MNKLIQIPTLVLDDETNIGEFMIQFLNENNELSILQFTNPDEFKEFVATHPTSIVILDIKIPGFDYNVFEMINYINDLKKGIYIIILSGFLTREDFSEFLNSHHVWGAVEKDSSTAWVKKIKVLIDEAKPNILLKLRALYHEAY